MEKDLFIKDLKRLVAEMDVETKKETGPDWRSVRLKAEELVILVNTVLEHENSQQPPKSMKKHPYAKR